jgi:hypothetical protein
MKVPTFGRGEGAKVGTRALFREKSDFNESMIRAAVATYRVPSGYTLRKRCLAPHGHRKVDGHRPNERVSGAVNWRPLHLKYQPRRAAAAAAESGHNQPHAMQQSPAWREPQFPYNLRRDRVPA